MAGVKKERNESATGRWIKSIRAANGLEQGDLAKIVSRVRSSIAGYENGNPVPRDVFETLLREYPDTPPPKDVELPKGVEFPKPAPVLGNAAYIEAIPWVEMRYAGSVPATTWGDPLAADTMERVDGKFAGRNRFCCRVIGDSCYPALRQGDLTIWEADKNPAHKVIVIAERFEDDGVTVKQLVYDPAQSRDVLKPVNPRYETPPDGNGWKATARLVGVVRQTDGPEKTWYWAPGLQPKHLMNDED